MLSSWTVGSPLLGTLLSKAAPPTGRPRSPSPSAAPVTAHSISPVITAASTLLRCTCSFTLPSGYSTLSHTPCCCAPCCACCAPPEPAAAALRFVKEWEEGTAARVAPASREASRLPLLSTPSWAVGVWVGFGWCGVGWVQMVWVGVWMGCVGGVRAKIGAEASRVTKSVRFAEHTLSHKPPLSTNKPPGPPLPTPLLWQNQIPCPFPNPHPKKPSPTRRLTPQSVMRPPRRRLLLARVHQQHRPPARQDAALVRDADRRAQVVAGHHRAADLGLLEALDHAGGVGAEGVGQDGEPGEAEGDRRL